MRDFGESCLVEFGRFRITTGNNTCDCVVLGYCLGTVCFVVIKIWNIFLLNKLLGDVFLYWECLGGCVDE